MKLRYKIFILSLVVIQAVISPITFKISPAAAAAVEFYNTSLYCESTTLNYYRLEGNSNDSKGSGNGTDTNITYNASYGQFGQGASFNGSTSLISTPDNSALYGVNSTTISFRMYQPTSVTANVTMISKWDYATQGTYAIQTVPTDGANIQVYVANAINSAGSEFVYSTDAAMSANTWYLITVVYDGTQGTNTTKVKIYVNGSLKTESSNSTIPTTLTNGTATTKIGNFGGSLNRPYNAYIDDVVIINRALSAAEVADLYNGSLGPATCLGGALKTSIILVE